MDKNELRACAATQLGLLGLAQLRDLDVSRAEIDRAVRSGFLHPVARGLYAIAGSPDTREQRCRAALLDAGADAALSHAAAAHQWKMWRRSPPLEVVRSRGRAIERPTLALVHRVRDLRPHHVLEIEGMRVTTPARTVMDLAAAMPLGLVARALDRAWGQRLLTLGALGAVLAEVRTRGRRGVRTVETLLDERIGHTPAESSLEYRFVDIARRFGLGPLRRQVDVAGADGWIGRVDFLHERIPLAVLIDGDAWHRAITQKAADDLETQRLRAAGIDVVRVSELEVLYDERVVVRRMRAASEPLAA